MKPHNRTTIHDVAKEAHVSVATVSRVINAPTRVRQETRDRVLKAMRKTHYVYNAIAGALSARKTGTLGVIVPTITNPVFAMVTKGIQDVAQGNGYAIFLGNTGYNEENEKELIRLLQEKRVDGIILNGPWRSSPNIPWMRENRLSFVITWQIPQDPEVSYVAFDNRLSAYRMVEYLIGLGHRRIGMIAGKFSISERAKMRWEGYRQCLSDHGLSADPRLVLQKEYTFADGKEAMARMLQLPSRPTAVFCGNDILAIGAIFCAKEKGLRVPQDISVVGFDDAEISAYYDPPLTTMAVPAYEMGELAAKILIENIRGGNAEPRQYQLEAKLIVRGSAERRRIEE
jgi:DNA-binding LacI/PurR family transcriptional regulator